jgi:hypothetical protein
MVETDHTLSEAVLSAVAEREGTEEVELPVPLHDAIDPDALDRLFRRSGGRVTFEYLDYLVTVADDGEVEVTEVASN